MSLHYEDKYKWYGWGHLEESYNMENRPDTWSYLEDKLDTIKEKVSVIELDSISLPALRLSDEVLNLLTDVCGVGNIDTSKLARLTHSLGQSYGDLLRLRKGDIANPVDAVVYPGSEKQIQEVLNVASTHQLAVVPCGGRTSVTGGLEVQNTTSYNGVISLDMRKMVRVRVDKVAHTVTAEAGIWGPDLEAAINDCGLTLGHFPQSFEFSSLGGWLATRSAGQNSTKYGKIEDMLISLRAVTPAGVLETKPVPSPATGPDLNQLFVGSEGILGVITEATLKLHSLPTSTEMRGVLFRTFQDGIQAVRTIMQSGIVPSVLRLSDETETEASFVLRARSQNRLKNMSQQSIFLILKRFGYTFTDGAMLLLVFDGLSKQAKMDRKVSMAICRKYGGISLGSSPGQSWHKERFKLPYLRDTLLDNGVMVDTLETSVTWDKIDDLYIETKNVIQSGIEKYGMSSLILTHVSHVYTEGASVYFTFMSKQKRGQERAQWLDVKTEAINAILKNGGALSHHHGIGRDHALWLEQEVGYLGTNIILSLKKQLDPKNILNPSNLVLLEFQK